VNESTNSEKKMVFRQTQRVLGRHVAVTPSNSTNKHLCYGRIVLDSSLLSVSFANKTHETGLICLSGAATVRTGERTFTFGQYDSIYIPRNSEIEIVTSSRVDFAEFSAEVANLYPLYFVPFEDVMKDPKLRFNTGSGGSTRKVNICLGQNIEAGRLLVGFTVSETGNWTSWPPHEHAKMLEEIYVYINMPAPGFGLQMVYNNTEYPEFVVAVREGDAVLIPSGYHPNVAVPGYSIGFLWAMAAHNEKEDRRYGVFNFQPEFN